MAVRTLDRAVLVCDARIVARRRHPIVAHQPGVTLCQILPRVDRQIAERRRQAVAAMLSWHATESPQGVLQAFRQGDEAFAAEHDMGMLESGERKPEGIE